MAQTPVMAMPQMSCVEFFMFIKQEKHGNAQGFFFFVKIIEKSKPNNQPTKFLATTCLTLACYTHTLSCKV